MFKKIVVASIVLVALSAIAGVLMAQGKDNQTAVPVASSVAVEIVPDVTPAVAIPVNAGNKFCPVTGEKVSGNDTVEYQGKVYNLCSPMCKDTFLADPAKYVDKAEKELGEEKAETSAEEKAEVKEDSSKAEGSAMSMPAEPKK